MQRVILLILTVSVLSPLIASELRDSGLPSPDGRFFAYTTPAYDDGTGSIIFVRQANPKTPSTRLLEGHRWIDAKWSPDSRFLAVVNHFDGHISDVYVFNITPTGTKRTKATLYYHTPGLGTYDTRWDVIGWNLKDRSIILSKEVRNQSAKTRITTKIVAKIGTDPIEMPDDTEAFHFPKDQ